MCFLVVALTTGSVVHAADNPVVPRKETAVTLKSGDSTTNVKVQDPDPYKNLHVPAPSDKYDPTRYSMNQKSSLAGKAFSADMFNPSRKGSDVTQGSYVTKSYNQPSSNNLPNKPQYSTKPSEGLTRNDSQFGKNYATPTSKMGSTQSGGFDDASKDQNRTASLSGKTSETRSANLSKQYLGPGAQHVPDGTVKENVVIAHVSDIPDRPLTIDEVRGLINHGFKPDTSAPADAPSKPINDPDYKPQASPEPDTRGRVFDYEKDSPLPSPGMMSQPPPENSEALPQH